MQSTNLVDVNSLIDEQPSKTVDVNSLIEQPQKKNSLQPSPAPSAPSVQSTLPSVPQSKSVESNPPVKPLLNTQQAAEKFGLTPIQNLQNQNIAKPDNTLSVPNAGVFNKQVNAFNEVTDKTITGNAPDESVVIRNEYQKKRKGILNPQVVIPASQLTPENNFGLNTNPNTPQVADNAVNKIPVKPVQGAPVNAVAPPTPEQEFKQKVSDNLSSLEKETIAKSGEYAMKVTSDPVAAGFITKAILGDNMAISQKRQIDKGYTVSQADLYQTGQVGITSMIAALDKKYESDPQNADYISQRADLEKQATNLIDKFPEYKTSQLTKAVAIELGKLHPEVRNSPSMARLYLPEIKKEMGLSDEDIKAIDFDNYPTSNFLTSTIAPIYKGALGLGLSATRAIGSALGADKDLLNSRLTEAAQSPTFFDDIETIQNTGQTVDVNKASPTFLQNIADPNKGKYNYNFHTISNAIGNGVGQLAWFVYGTKGAGAAANKALGAVAGAAAGDGAISLNGLPVKLSADATNEVGMAGLMMGQGYEDYYQKARTVISDKPEDELKRHAYSLINGALDYFGFRVLGNVVKGLPPAAEKEIGQIFKDAPNLAAVNKKALQSTLTKVLKSVGEATKETAFVEGATTASELAKAVVTNVMGNDEAVKEENKQLPDVILSSLAASPFQMWLPILGSKIIAGGQSKVHKENIYNAGISPENYKGDAHKLFDMGAINQEQLNDRIQVINTADKVVKSIPSDVFENLNHNQRVTYVNSKIRELALKAKSEGIQDEALAAYYADQIKVEVAKRSEVLNGGGKEGEFPESVSVIKPKTQEEINNQIPTVTIAPKENTPETKQGVSVVLPQTVERGREMPTVTVDGKTNENATEKTAEVPKPTEAASTTNEAANKVEQPTEESLVSQAKDLVNSGVVKGYTAETLKESANNNPAEFQQHLKDISEQANDPKSNKATVDTYGKELVDIAQKLNPVTNGLDDGQNKLVKKANSGERIGNANQVRSITTPIKAYKALKAEGYKEVDFSDKSYDDIISVLDSEIKRGFEPILVDKQGGSVNDVYDWRRNTAFTSEMPYSVLLRPKDAQIGIDKINENEKTNTGEPNTTLGTVSPKLDINSERKDSGERKAVNGKENAPITPKEQITTTPTEVNKPISVNGVKTEGQKEELRSSVSHLLSKPNEGRADLLIGKETQKEIISDAFTYTTRGTNKKTYNVDINVLDSKNGTRYLAQDKDGDVLAGAFVDKNNNLTGIVTDKGYENVGIGTNLYKEILKHNPEVKPDGTISKQGQRLIERAAKGKPISKPISEEGDLVDRIKAVQKKIFNEDGSNKKGATKEDMALNEKLMQEYEASKNKPEIIPEKEFSEVDKLQNQKNDLSKQKDIASDEMDKARSRVFDKNGVLKKNVKQSDIDKLQEAKSKYDSISKEVESIDNKQKELRSKPTNTKESNFSKKLKDKYKDFNLGGTKSAEKSDTKNEGEIKTDNGKQPIEQYVSRAKEVLNKLFPDATFESYKTKEEYEKAGGAEGTRGMFITESDGSKRLLLNVEQMKEDGIGKTAFHEAIHPIVDEVVGAHPEELNPLWNDLYKEMQGVKGFDKVVEHVDLYKQNERPAAEGLTELLTQIAEGNIALDDVPPARKGIIVDLLNKLFEKLGLNIRFGESYDFKDFATDIKKAFETGDVEALKNVVDKRAEANKRATENAGKVNDLLFGKSADKVGNNAVDAKAEYEKELEKNLEDLRERRSSVTYSERKLNEQEKGSKTVSGYIRKLLHGVTPEDVESNKARLADQIKQYRKEKADLRALLPKERGSNFVIEKLSRAARNGDIEQQNADLAIDLIRKRPDLFSDLAISITKNPNNDSGVEGWYRAADALVKLFKNPTNDTTSVHEILHHTERFLPQEVRAKIIKEWNNEVNLQIADIQKKLKSETNVDTRKQLTQGLLYLGLAQERQVEPNYENAQAMEHIMSKYLGDHTDSNGNFHKGLGNTWYKLYNPSEWWAVNASKMLQDAANKPELKTWQDKVKAFYVNLVQSVKKVFKNPYAAVEKGLKTVLDGKTLENREGQMLSQSKRLLNIQDETKGRFETAASKIADFIRNADIPQWIINTSSEAKQSGFGLSGENMKEALAKSIEAVGKIMDKGVDLKEAISREVDNFIKNIKSFDGIKDLKPTFEKTLRDGFEKEALNQFSKEQSDRAATVESMVKDAMDEGFETLSDIKEAITNGLGIDTPVFRKMIDDAYEKVSSGDGGKVPPTEKATTGSEDFGDKGQRRFTKQVLKDEAILPKEEIQKNLDYIKQKNVVTVKEAEDVINKVGVDEAYDLVVSDSELKPSVRTTVGQMLIKKFNTLAAKAPDQETKEYYWDKTIKTADFVSEKLGTEAGQGIQTFALFSELSPEAQLRGTIKEIKKQAQKKIEKRKPDVNDIGDKFKKANEETVEEITKEKEVKTRIEKAEKSLSERAQDKIKKARARREKIIAKYKSEKRTNLYSGVGLTKEGIEYVGELAKTYIDEGVANLQIIADKIKDHLIATTNKDVDENVYKSINEVVSKKLNQEDLKTIGGVKDLKIGQIVKEHYTVVEKTKSDLVKRLVEESGLEKEEAQQLATKIQDAFDRVATRKKQDILAREAAKFNRIKKDLDGAKKVDKKTLQAEIIKFSNLGAFDNDGLLAMLGERLGTGQLTPEQGKEIQRLAEQVQTAPEGSPKADATQDLLKYRANLKGNSWAEITQGVWYANVLSGYMTHIRNIVSTFFNGTAFVAGELARDPKSLPVLLYGGARGFKRGGIEAWHTLTTGRSPIHISKIETPQVLERIRFKGGLLNPVNYLKYVNRLMVAEDVIQFQGLKEMRATQLAYREAKRLGYKNPFSKAVWKYVNENLLNTKERYEVASEQAASEGLKGNEARRRTYELMEQSRPIQMQDDAYGFAAKGTFNHDTEGTLGALSDWASRFIDNGLSYKGAKPLRFLVPFTRIITNVANNSLDFSPIGLVRGARGERGLFASETSGKKTIMSKEEKQQELIKGALGTASMLALYGLSQAGVVQVSGAGPSDYRKRLQLQQEGWQPFSIKIGKTYYSYKLTPMVFAWGVVGSIRDHEQYDKDSDEQTLIERSTLAVWDGARLISDMTWVNSAAPIMAAISESNPGAAGTMLSNTATGIGKGFVLPSAYTQSAEKIEQIFHVPQKQTKGLFQSLITNVPIARNQFNDKINALGDPIVKDVDILTSKETTDPVWKFLLDKKGWVAPVNRNTLILFDINTREDRPATDDEYYEFSKIRGAKIKEDIKNIMQEGAYVKTKEGYQFKKAEDLTSAELNKVLTPIKTRATKEAKNELLIKANNKK